MAAPVLRTLLLFVGIAAAQDGGLLADCPEELAVCLKARLVGSLDRVARLQRLEIAPGLAVLRDPASSPSPPPTSEAALLDSLASSRSDDKEAALDSMIADKVASIFEGRYLRIDLTQPTEEGRAGKKRRGVNALLMMMLMMASMMLPLKMGALAMLAGKALIISKLALALAAIVGLKKLLGGDDHQDSYQVVQVPAGHSHRKRSLDLPYRAYRPT
ncbi:uncharacterized protein [Halyomorpha halys]|uniref:uncharacterized protein n=1 Tax=Halyomorpha halys TaxID=286706 RepID=UPI0006D514F9|nr:uncharacterized protein LOC106678535 [Halyomorpha halys]